MPARPVRVAFERVSGRVQQDGRAGRVGYSPNARRAWERLVCASRRTGRWNHAGGACLACAAPPLYDCPPSIWWPFYFVRVQDEKEIAPGGPGVEPIVVPIYFCSGDARKMCVIFGGLALSAAVFGVLTNEFDAIKETERPFWWMLLGELSPLALFPC